MKILAFSDTHAEKEYEKEVIRKANDCDILICAGDFAFVGKYNLEFFEELNKIGKPIYVIFGNHESLEDCYDLESRFENIYCIHNKIIEFEGYTISGFGDLEFREYDENLEELIKSLKRYKNIIFVSHVPPKDTALDIIWNEHRGNPQLTDLIIEVKPILHICGHFHENVGVYEKFIDTLIVNPGPLGMVIEI